MAYFPNGTAGMMYQERFCFRCKNHRDNGDGRGPGCAVWDAHLIFPTHHTPDPAKPPETSKEAAVLDILIPREDSGIGNKECSMFAADVEGPRHAFAF